MRDDITSRYRPTRTYLWVLLEHLDQPCPVRLVAMFGMDTPDRLQQDIDWQGLVSSPHHRLLLHYLRMDDRHMDDRHI